MNVKYKLLLLCLLSCSFISCDQVTKSLAKQHLMYSAPSSYFHDFFRLEYAENTGAALSLGADLPQPHSFILLSILPLLAMVGLLLFILINIRKFSPFRIFCFTMIFAGGIGNLIDRIFNDRHVTDFMNLGIYSLRTGIFNVADICVTAGVIGIFISYYRTPENTDTTDAQPA